MYFSPSLLTSPLPLSLSLSLLPPSFLSLFLPLLPSLFLSLFTSSPFSLPHLSPPPPPPPTSLHPYILQHCQDILYSQCIFIYHILYNICTSCIPHVLHVYHMYFLYSSCTSCISHVLPVFLCISHVLPVFLMYFMYITCISCIPHVLHVYHMSIYFLHIGRVSFWDGGRGAFASLKNFCPP